MNIFKLLPWLLLFVSLSLAGQEDLNRLNHTYISEDGSQIIFEYYDLRDLPIIPSDLRRTYWQTDDSEAVLYFKDKVLFIENLENQKQRVFPFIEFSNNYENCLIFLGLNNLVCMDKNENNETILFLFYRVHQLYFGDGSPLLTNQKLLHSVQRE